LLFKNPQAGLYFAVVIPKRVNFLGNPAKVDQNDVVGFAHGLAPCQGIMRRIDISST
jgi:hypothetical protein